MYCMFVVADSACDLGLCVNARECIEEDDGDFTCVCRDRWTGRFCDIRKFISETWFDSLYTK